MNKPVHNADTTVTLLPKTLLITPVLGRISAQTAQLVEGVPHSNSTRWIFDVDGGAKEPVVIQLLGFKSKQPASPDLVSGSLLPRSASFFEARPFLETLEDGKLVLVHVSPVPCRYRVCVDTMHTATR